jgi:multiple antibiotic resistance protein
MDSLFQTESFFRTIQLAYAALFAVLNPPGIALVFHAMTAHATPAERAWLARRVAAYALLVMLLSLFAGSFLLSLFGLSVDAVRAAGGLLIGHAAWKLLQEPVGNRPDPDRPVGPLRDLAIVPLTIPLTAGPGTISVLVAYGSSHPLRPFVDGGFLAGLIVAAVAAALTVWVAYHYADRVARRLGPVGERTATRLSGFLLLCIAAQMMLTGASKLFDAAAD